MSDRGGAMMGAAQEAASSIEETLEEVITNRPLATVGLALGIGFLIGAAWRDKAGDDARRKTNTLGRWRRWSAAASFVGILYQTEADRCCSG